MDLFELSATIALDSNQFVDGLDKSESRFSGFASKVKSGLQSAAKVGAAAVEAISTAAVKMGEALIDGVGEAAEYGDNIDKMSQKLGMSAESFQEWDAVMQHSGSSVESLKRGMMTLGGAMDELRSGSERTIDTSKVEKAKTSYDNAVLSVQKAQIAYDEAVKKHGKGSSQAQKAALTLQQAQNKATEAQSKYNSALEGSAPKLSTAAATLEGLGVKVKDASGNMRSQEDVFSDVVTALQNIEDESKRSALAQDIFGKSASELGPLLNTSAEDTQAMKDRVHELGGVMSNEAVKAAAAYQDSLQDMQTALDGTKRNLMSEFLPSFTAVMDGITELFTTGGTEKLGEGINQFVDKFSELIPKVLEIGSGLVLSLGSAVVENLPTLIDAATQTIITLTTGIVENLPMIVEAGLQVLVTLAGGISDNLPTLIPTVIEVLLEVVNILTDPQNLMQLVAAAVAIMIALSDGLIEALPELIEAAPALLAAGGKLLGSIVTGIKKHFEDITQAASDIVGIISTAIGDAIEDALTWGTKLIDNFIDGIVEQGEQLLNAVDGIVEGIIGKFKGIIDAALNWGKDMIDNFKNGIENAKQGLLNGVKNVGQGIKNFLGFSEPEEGPLSNFHTYAPDMMQLFAEGIRENEHLITDQLNKSFDIAPTLTQQITTAPAPAAPQPIILPRTQDNTPRMLTVILELERQVVARTVYQLNNEETQRVGVKLAY